ncbi:MAG: hypothetical protein H6550_05300 [Chitinophagales bacterium]|nr:hypothetical protein [Chitinophagales bacterium]
MNNKAGLIWTRILMVASIMLLSAFVVYWLNSQYNDERELLQKELAGDLDRAQKEVTDSVIFEKYIAPVVLGNNKDSATSPFRLNDSVFSFKGQKIYISNSIHDSVDVDSIQKAISGKLKALDGLASGRPRKIKLTRSYTNTNLRFNDSDLQIEQSIILSGKDDSAGYGISNLPDLATKPNIKLKFDSSVVMLVTSGLRSLMKSAFKDSISALSLRLEFTDSALVRDEFAKGLAIRNPHMRLSWKDDTINKNTGETILIDYDNYGNKGTVAITGYNWYLIQKILPQLLFSVLLIIFVLLSFMVTYKNIKRQIRLNDMKNGLISNMSHELKTPVATVKVALEALDDFGVMNDPQKALEYIHMAKLETQRLEMLISKALNTSLMEQGKITIQRELTDIAELTKETIELLKIRLEQNNAEIAIKKDGSDFFINVDKLHVQGALLNIIDNSLKYSTATVHIQILVTASDAGVRIDIRDDGPGIPAAYAGQVFDKFFRVPKGDEHNVQGYGLGLSYVQQVMQLHNGVARLHDSSTGAHFSLQFYKGR